MRGLQILTNEALAEKLFGLYGFFDGEELLEISDKVAKVLSAYRRPLYLINLRELSDVAAKHLSFHECGGSINDCKVTLSGLESLSNTAAKYLSKYKPDDDSFAGRGFDVSLDGIKKISDEALTHLLESEARFSFGDALKKRISRRRKELAKRNKSVAETALSTANKKKIMKLLKTKKAENVRLAINLLQSIGTEEDGRAIFSSAFISLMINTWDVAVWNEIAAYLKPKKELYTKFQNTLIRRFRNLSLKEIRIAGLSCNYWETSEEKQATFISAYINDIERPLMPVFEKIAKESYMFLDLSQFSSLTPNAVKLIILCSDANLAGLKSLPEDIAAGLSKSDVITLSGLTELSVEAADHLGKSAAESLDLSGLQTLSAEVAAALSLFEGHLNLTGLNELSADAVRALSTNRGEISLSSLKVIVQAIDTR